MTQVEDKEIINKKRYLRRYRKNQAKLERLEEKLVNLDSRIYSLRSPTISDMPKGGQGITSEDLMAEKLELQDRINRVSRQGKRIRSEILDKIDQLDDTRHAEILEAYFIDRQDFSSIAEELGYTIRHVIRLYSEGIRLIDINDS